MNVLVTAFEPFGGSEVNASMAAMELLPETIGKAYIMKLRLPTVFGGSWDKLSAALEKLRPDALICLGEAAGRAEVCFERVAVNLMDARIADNSGARPVDEPIDPEGAAAYFSTLPTRVMSDAALSAGVPARLSYTAGTYVCNYIMYMALRSFGRRGPCGFIHVPALPIAAVKRAGTPSMDARTAAAGLKAAIAALAEDFK